MSITIREARPDDEEAILHVETQSFKGDRLSQRSIRRHLRSGRADMLVAARGREVLGYAMTLHRSGSSIGRVYSIAVLREARGQGLAGKLLKASERACLRRGGDRMRLEVRTDNSVAVGFYESSGYKPIGRYEQYYEDGAAALRFEKRLS